MIFIKNLDTKKRPPCFGERSEDSLKNDSFVSNFTVSVNGRQAVLSTTGDEIGGNFTPKKEYSLLLADSYERLGQTKRAFRVRSCSSILKFAHEILPDNSINQDGVLVYADFCRDRLCPQCSRRRSLKIFGQVSQIMDYFERNQEKYKFLFLTLTVRSCTGAELPAVLDRMYKAIIKMFRKKKIKECVLGAFRALEITRNFKRRSNAFGLYHPHFHLILAVPPTYAQRDSFYIHQSEWLEMWRNAYGDENITQVYIEKIKSDSSSDEDLTDEQSKIIEIKKAVAEVSKYAVKSSDYIFPENYLQTDETVGTLAGALKGRRLVSFTGVFKKAFEALQLEDAEADSVDLLHCGDEKTLNPALSWVIVTFHWSIGVYKITKSEVSTPEQRKQALNEKQLYTAKK